LTAEGLELLPASSALLAQSDRLLEHARALSQGDSGELRVGATPHTIANIFPEFLRLFAAEYPRVRVKTVEAAGIDQWELLRRGELHAALTVLEGVEAEFIVHPLPALWFLVAHNSASGLKFGDRVEIRELAAAPLLLMKEGFGTRKVLDAVCRLERVAPNVFMESSTPETLLALARGGHGAAIVPTSARIDGTSLRLAPLFFRGRLLTVEAAVLWHRERRLPRYAEPFSTMLAAHMRAIMPRPGWADRAEPAASPADTARIGGPAPIPTPP
jgi:DNA-binding transcriptional LysR family regulator